MCNNKCKNNKCVFDTNDFWYDDLTCDCQYYDGYGLNNDCSNCGCSNSKSTTSFMMIPVVEE